MKFFCSECGWIGDLLGEYKDEDGAIYFCPQCEADMFLSQDELEEYLYYPEPAPIIPFEKSKTMER